MPLHFRGAVTATLDWLASLPKTVLDARPSLWVRHAAFLLVNRKTTGVERNSRLPQQAMAALPGAEPVPNTVDGRTLSPVTLGRTNCCRKGHPMALTQYQVETMLCPVAPRSGIFAPRRTVFPLPLPFGTLAFACYLQETCRAGRAYAEALSISQASGISYWITLTANGLAKYRKRKISFIWRPRLTGMFCNC